MTKAANLAALSSGPAFSAYNGSGQSIAHNTNTKLQINTENLDTNNAYDSVTNYRFQPQVAGYYLMTISCTFNGATTAGGVQGAGFYKNGTGYGPFAFTQMTSVNYTVSSNTVILYLNGSTDYVEAYILQNGGSTISTVAGSCIFQGALIRAA